MSLNRKGTQLLRKRKDEAPKDDSPQNDDEDEANDGNLELPSVFL